MSRVLLVASDLLWVGKVRTLAARSGWEVAVPERKTDVTQLLLDADTRLVVLDLHNPRFDYVETIRLVRGTRWDTHMLCFGHHTDKARLDHARALGATDVVANSQVEGRLLELLAGRQDTG